MTPLLVAVSGGNVEMTKLLLSKGADKEARNADGDNGLTIAVNEGRTEMVECLLERRVNVNAARSVCEYLLCI